MNSRHHSSFLLLLLLAVQLQIGFDVASAFTKSDCFFPFVFNGTEFYYCTHYGFHTLWCSLDRVYVGRWASCGPEVPKEVMESIKTAMTEIGKEKAKLAAEQIAIDSVAKSVTQLAKAGLMADINRTSVQRDLDHRLGALNRTLKELELHQKNLDQRQSNQESLQPLEIGMMVILTVAVIAMGVGLFAWHCRQPAGKLQSASSCDVLASSPSNQQLGTLSVNRVQPVQPAQGTAAADAKQFPGHFYRLTIDEEPVEEEGDEEEDDEDEDEEDEEAEELDNGQHSAAAAVLANPSNR